MRPLNRCMAYSLLYMLIALLLCTGVSAQTPPASPPATTETIAPVQQIEFTGNTALTSDELRRAAGINPGEPLTSKMLSDAISRIQAAYTERGYIADFIYYEIQGQQPPRTLLFHIREVRISDIQITGLKTTREETVRRFIQINPGELYNQRAVRNAVTRLTSLGIFSDISVFLREGSAPGQVVLVFQTTEAKTQRIDLGGTYDPSGRLVLRVGFVNSNFRGRAEQVTADVGIGTLEGKLSGSASYFNPAAPSPDRTLLVRAFSEVNFRFSEDLVNTPNAGRYFERHTGAQSVWNRYMPRNRQLTYAFRYDNINTRNFPFQFVAGDLPTPNGWVLIPSARLIQDNRVTLVFPVSGTYTLAQIAPGYSNPTSGPSGFIARLEGDLRWLFPLQRITPEILTAEPPRPIRTFVTRLSGGVASGPLPFYEQFFLGGVDSLRGYRESQFWGKYSVLLNNEYRWPLSREVIGIGFVDIGDAWGSDFQIASGVPTDFPQHRGFSPRGSYGVGVWYISPVLGFVRIVYAKGDKWRLGLAIGESF